VDITGERSTPNMKAEEILKIRCWRFDGTIAGDPQSCRGNTQIVRVGDRVFATFTHQEADRESYNHACLELYEKRGNEPWKMVYRDEGVYQMDPCPIVYLGDDKLAVTANPTVVRYTEKEPSRFVPCTPVVYIFDISEGVQKIKTKVLPWNVPAHQFFDHSYRGISRDMGNGDMFFLNQFVEYGESYNSGINAHGKKGMYAGFCYTLLDKDFRILRMGELYFQPERGIHQCIALNNGEAYIFAHSGGSEYNKEWHEFKYELTGDQWDYIERELYLLYSPNIRTEEFAPCETVYELNDTCGWVENLDCCFDANGDMLLLVSEETIRQPAMKERFFPDVEPEAILSVCRFSHGKLVEKTEVDRSAEEPEKKVKYNGFLHTASSGEVYVVWGKGNGKMFLNRHIDFIKSSDIYLSAVSALDKAPIKLQEASGDILFGNKTRLGALPGDIVDIYYRDGDRAIMHAQHDLKEVLAAYE